MVKQTVVTLVDDLDPNKTATETVDFGIGGVTYEIDLDEGHAAALRESLADYIARARRISGRRRTGRRPAGLRTGSPARSTPSGQASVDREQNQAIRDWARRQGMTVSDRGRIPNEVIEAFHNRDTAAAPINTPAAAAATDKPTDKPADEPAENESVGGEPVGRDGLTGSERERIRSWAREEGIEVKTRGILSRDVIGNYRSVMARRSA